MNNKEYIEKVLKPMFRNTFRAYYKLSTEPVVVAKYFSEAGKMIEKSNHNFNQVARYEGELIGISKVICTLSDSQKNYRIVLNQLTSECLNEIFEEEDPDVEP